MKTFQPILEWIVDQKPIMQELVVKWADINSFTHNLEGLETLSKDVQKAFVALGADVRTVGFPEVQEINAKGEMIPFQTAPAVTAAVRPEASKQILCVIHMDTVYPPESAFQTCQQMDADYIQGPGVTDAKGGLVVMLKVLEAIEQSPYKDKLGWQVILNTDEEIGSPASGSFLQEQARNFDLGLVFEPPLEDGALVSSRKGSANFTFVCHGKSAHAGRDHAKGINAIDALGQCIVNLSVLSHQREGLTVNCGKIYGGTAMNVVPDLAILSFNVRVLHPEDPEFVKSAIKRICMEVEEKHQVTIDIHGGFGAPPKPLTKDVEQMLNQLKNSAKNLGFDLKWRESGGVCDGNRLIAAGLPTVDTLGVVGGKIHSHEEYIFLPSLVERTQLTTLFLLRWITGE